MELPAPCASTSQPSTTDAQPAISTGPIGSGRQRNGFVARLPKSTRDRICQMLLDHVPYLDIIEKLGLAAHGIDDSHMTTWKAGGYQDWLRQQQKVDLLRSKQEFAMDLVRDKGAEKVHQATLQVAAANLCEMLVDLEPTTLRQMLQEDPDKYTRLLNTIVRLSDGHIKAEKFTAEAAERAAALAKAKAAPQPGGISDEALEAAEARLRLM